jgi:23S rRNA (pseudouridine1915-N3)-methyltransferase
VKLLVVAVGGVKGAFEPAVTEYETRARRYWKLETVEVDPGAPGRRPSPSRVLSAEEERIRRAIPPGTEYWVLTRKGKGLSSEAWARLLGDRGLQGGRDLALVVGGAYGLSASLVEGAGRRISLASVTLPHEMARLVLVEQLYRAGKILKNEPYHKGSS